MRPGENQFSTISVDNSVGKTSKPIPGACSHWFFSNCRNIDQWIFPDFSPAYQTKKKLPES
jgi:hypothetical protein